MTNFSDMLSKAKVMQEKMKEAQDQIKKIEVEGLSGGDLVKIVLSVSFMHQHGTTWTCTWSQKLKNWPRLTA